jgi:predicted metal-dependent enzyme (double-stranded beta helix superfamily)
VKASGRSAELGSGPRDVVDALRTAERDPEAAAEVVGRMVRSPEHLERMLGVEDRAGITVLDAQSDLTVQRVIWPAGLRIAPHDHRMWAAIGVYRGSEYHWLFAPREPGLAETNIRRVDEGTVLALEPDAIHAVANLVARPCVALHVYGGNLDATARSTWERDGTKRRFDLGARRAMVRSFEVEENRLGRPVTIGETRALVARMSNEQPPPNQAI